jgi:hypothetical protein
MKLEAQGFRGTVKVVSNAGVFCLAGNSADSYAPAAATTVVTKCDLVGNPFDDNLSTPQRQSLAFANLISGVRLRTAGAIAVTVDHLGSGHPVSDYPARNDTVTAAEWNRAAAANNRVEFIVEPAAG